MKLCLNVTRLLLIITTSPLTAIATQTVTADALPTRPLTAKHTIAPVNVTGVAAIKAEARALQEIKVALKRPISSSAADANLTVCRIDHGHESIHVVTRMGAELECGTNSWWAYRETRCQTADGDPGIPGTMIVACAAGQFGAAYKHPGMWHILRTLTLRQVMYLRQVTDMLPPPNSKKSIIVTGYLAAHTNAPAATSEQQ